MKKIFLCLTVAFLATSCTTVVKTAKTADTPVSLLSSTVADLEVSPERITYTKTGAELKGYIDVKQAVEHSALEKVNADVLVNPEYVIKTKNYIIFKKVESVTVSGRPARYKNFHSLNDSVWCNPVFRSNLKESGKSGSGLLNKLF